MQCDEMSGHVCFGRVHHGDATMCSLHVCGRLAVLRSTDLSLSSSLNNMVSRCMLSSNDFGSCSETTRTVSSVRACVVASFRLPPSCLISEPPSSGRGNLCLPDWDRIYIHAVANTSDNAANDHLGDMVRRGLEIATNDEDQTSQETRSSSSEDVACEHRY